MSAFKKVESLRTLLEFFPLYGNTTVLPPINSLRALRTGASKLSTLKNLTHLRLQKLQILKLEECNFLSCLPKHLTRLQDLRHLVIEKCPSLVTMPPKIGKLKCLKTLSTFIVDSKAGYELSELRDLQLGGKLHIKGLENFRSESDAKDANLMNKKDLKCLYLSWDSNAKSQCSDVKTVVEALQPPPNLKCFGMRGYKGMQLARWMRNTSFLESLVDVILYECKNCEQFPPLGKLPYLTRLFISGVKDVKHIDEDSYDGVDEKAFKSLKNLSLIGLPNLEGMLRDEGVEMLPLLSKLNISCVPKFKLPCLPSVEHLRIYGFELKNFDGIEDVASFPEEIVRNMHHVKTLNIGYMLKLKVLPDELGNLSGLQELTIEYGDELESLPDHVLQGLSSLRSLCIKGCNKLKDLSEGVRHLTSLKLLDIVECPQLVTLPSTMDQLTSLGRVIITGVDRDRKLPTGLQGVPSLQSLTLVDVDSLPDWLGDMTSLQQLYIVHCPNLRSLPSSLRHLTNLCELTIYKCPKLQKRCNKETGEDWKNIAHIPQFNLVSVQEDTFFETIRFSWNARKINRDPYFGEPDFEFDSMVDEF